MSQRHPTQHGCIMLVTTVTKNRYPYFSDDTLAREAVEAIYRTQTVHTFFLFGFVIMPDHCHLLLHVPPPEKISTVIKSYKSSVSFGVARGVLWQPRFHIRIVQEPWRALQYIHENPVNEHLVTNSQAYRWSSASRLWDITELADVM